MLKTDVYPALGDWLRIHRWRSGLTQEQAAERAALSTRELSNIENGIHAPRLPVLLRLCDLYRVSLEQLRRETAAPDPLKEGPEP
jgi:transcriptional regulator with XRE-family HTH domain